MKLSSLTFDLSAHQPIPTLEITNLTENSKLASSSSLFVCIAGAVADGHSYARAAYENGCRAFVAQKKLDLPIDATVFYVEDTRRTLATLACRFYGHPTKRMRVIGITGTKGKTTTARLIAQILNRSSIPCGYIGTNGILYGNKRMDTKNTTPDAVTLQRTFSEMLRDGIQTAVLEVSSQALKQFRADGIEFDTVLFTNLFPDHIGDGEHRDMEEYKSCKKRLFTEFPFRRFISWADDPFAAELNKGIEKDKCFLCSALDERADFYIQSIRPERFENGLGVSFDLCRNETRSPVSLPLLGKINAQNAALALAVATERFAIDLSVASESLKQAAVTGRSETILLPSGAFVCLDYAHNGASLQQLLTSLAEYHPSRLTVLFGSVGERTQMRRAEMGRVAALYADRAILTSDNPGKEDPEAIIADIAVGFSGTDTPFVSIPDRKEAIRYALEHTAHGEILVLAGKGHEAYQLIGTQKLPFSEREIVEAFITAQKEKPQNTLLKT
ncbi:MAG: UDP-N-acetylmuramoyl-L-alanyl-D-glutamate--2,6-diaminopimelate ligase [Ruminococcaceae bacterium]|nr:UDP-N-acetylmuramoyl-L-alanyl-D-glutamate--2,6-diaminopimelate ligase [Oscillospiraceae bacterium]